MGKTKKFKQYWDNGKGSSIEASFDGKEFKVIAIVGGEFRRWVGEDPEEGRKKWWGWGAEMGLRPLNNEK